jgi:hypothetical protein
MNSPRYSSPKSSHGTCHEPQRPSSPSQRGKDEGVRFSLSQWWMFSARSSYGHVRRYWVGALNLEAIWLSARVC